MLYPDLNELIAFKDRKSNLKHPASRSVKSTVSGNHHSPFRGQGLEFDSVREYVAGDDIRCIDWRVTARTGRAHLKIFKEDRERQTIVCVDMNTSMRFGTRNTFKSVQAARVAAILGWQAIARHDRVSACLFGDVSKGMQFFEPKRTHKCFSVMLKTLAEPPVEAHDVSLDEVILQINQASHTGALVYVISDFKNAGENLKHQASLSRLAKRCDVVFIAINDPLDKSFFPAGMIRFCSVNGEKIPINTDSASGRKNYAADWSQERLLLNEMTASLKIPMIELSTESDIFRDLTFGLKNIARRKVR